MARDAIFRELSRIGHVLHDEPAAGDRVEINLHAIEQTQLRRKHRVDGVGA